MIEHKSIDYVAPSERHGRVLGQVPFWFLGNFHFFTIAIGFVGPGMGLSFGYTALAGTLGILFGTLFVAFHASQGAELGVPQMIQSRAQFGFRGVIVVLVGTLFTFVGFNIANGVLIGSGLRDILGWNAAAVTIVTAALGALLAIYGHDWLHRVFRGCFLLCLPLYSVLTVAIAGHAVAPTQLAGGAFTASGFFAQFAASASYNITYAPSVSDYSRYLPRETRPRSIIAAVYLGAAASAIWLIILGAWLATRMGEDDGLAALYHAGNALAAGFGTLIALASVSALTATIGLNAYSGMLTLVTGLSSLFELRPTPRQRVLCIVGLAIVWTGVALALSVNSIALLFAVLTIMLYLLVPWTSINLIDYFGVRRGHYAITQLFVPHGLYGDWAARGLTAYLLGVAAELPFFVVPDLYIGPAARALGGVDVGWLVGLIVSGAIYLALSRQFDPATEAAAIGDSERLLAQPR